MHRLWNPTSVRQDTTSFLESTNSESVETRLTSWLVTSFSEASGKLVTLSEPQFFHCKIGITMGLLKRVEMMCKTPGMWKALNKWWLVRVTSKQANLSNQQTDKKQQNINSQKERKKNHHRPSPPCSVLLLSPVTHQHTKLKTILSYLPQFQLPPKKANHSRTAWLSL